MSGDSAELQAQVQRNLELAALLTKARSSPVTGLSDDDEEQAALLEAAKMLPVNYGLVPPAYQTKVVQRGPSDALNGDEQQCIDARSAVVRKAINELRKKANLEPLGESQKVPRVAICLSGGGFRAMIGTCAYLNWFKKHGLLDCVTFVAGLSGSSWTLGAWFASVGNPFVGQRDDDDQVVANSDPWRADSDEEPGIAGLEFLTANNLKNPLVAKQMLELASKKGDLVQAIVRKMSQARPLSATDLYGLLLGSVLLAEGRRFEMYLRGWSDSAAKLKASNGALPVPICTAVMRKLTDKQWVEFTPFEVGSLHQGVFVPTNAFGMKFRNGQSVEGKAAVREEDLLHYQMGIWGSAFAANVQQVIAQLLPQNRALRWLRVLAAKIGFSRVIEFAARVGDSNIPFMASNVHNWAHGVKSADGQPVPTSDEELLVLVDAGLHFNLPMPPLTQSKSRAVDLILACDMSATVDGPSELAKAELFYKEQGWAFPSFVDESRGKTADGGPRSVDMSGWDKKCKLFETDGCPAILYLPALGPKIPETDKWSYTEKEINDYMGLITANLDACKDEIFAQFLK